MTPRPAAANPALVPESATRTAREYTVVGKRTVRDTKPGKTFTALFTPEQEAALIEAGHIKVVEAKASGGPRTN